MNRRKTASVALPAAALYLFTAACVRHDVAAAARTSVIEATPDSASDSMPMPRTRTPAASDTSGHAAALELQNNPNAIVRGLYLNRFAVQSPRKMARLLAIADSTEINAFVVDVKDEFGLNFVSLDPVLQRNAGTMDKATNLTAWVDSMRAHGILPIARIVVFKDSIAARMNPDYVIRRPDGQPWRDKGGLTWVNPYANAIWEYNFRVGDEAIRMGFGEIQFDYIRFPEPYKSLPPQVFPERNGRDKSQALAEFLTAANTRYDKRGVRTTADVFGLVTTVNGTLEVGQKWEPLSRAVDVMLPMVYPSHYPRGSFGIDRPNADPHGVIYAAISRARDRDSVLGLGGEHVRPWLQAFTLGQPRYGPKQVTAQKQAVYDAGYDGWVMWNAGSSYDVFLPALEKTLVSRKNPVSAPPADTTPR